MNLDSNRYSGKHVAIVGFGAEGESALRYFEACGATVTVLDQAPKLSRPVPEGVEVIVGPHAFDDLSPYDIVSRTPPVHPNRVSSAKATTSVTREFFAHCTAPIIGVTGTKGKGTTTTLIARMLEATGKKVHLVGNVGIPALDVLADISPDDIVCYEISSFQLWDMEVSPPTAVVLMITQDHLDEHITRDDYVAAKARIAKFQLEKDVVIHHPTNETSVAVAKHSLGKQLPYMTEDAAHIRGEDVIIDEQIICSVTDVGLPGPHNLENICAALTAAWQYSQDADKFAQAIKDFTGLEHRIEHVRTYNGVDYINDSYSSAPLATQAAVRSFPDREQVVILGGKDKQGDYTDAIKAIFQSENRAVVVYGENRELLAKTLKDQSVKNVIVVDGDLGQVVAKATEAAESGDVVIFSPGTSSFDMFLNFVQRGKTFKKLVMEL